MDLSVGVPDRAAVLPFLVVAIPVFWFLYRAGASPGRYLVATAACLVVAVIAAAAMPTSPPSPFLRSAVRPSDATIVVLSAVVGATVVYVGLGETAGGVPPAVGQAARPAGLVLGVPLLAALWFSYRLGDWFGEPSMLTQGALVALGLGLTAVWIFALASAVGRVVTAVA